MTESDEIRLTRLEEKHEQAMSAIKRIERKVDLAFVTRAEFWPVKTIVYGGAGIVLTAVVGVAVAVLFQLT